MGARVIARSRAGSSFARGGESGRSERVPKSRNICKPQLLIFFARRRIGQASECECMRVRKDWNMLRAAEKNLYVEAVNDLKQSGVYDLLVQTHANLDNKEVSERSERRAKRAPSEARRRKKNKNGRITESAETS